MLHLEEETGVITSSQKWRVRRGDKSEQVTVAKFGVCERAMAIEKSTDVLIAGGGLGGCAAALAVCRAGFRAILTEETDWLGGQLTAQAVPPDEHGWIERFGCTASYRQLRNAIRNHYRGNPLLTESARNNPLLNPGAGWVSPLCHEPRVAWNVLQEMLRPYVAAGLLVILTEHRPVHAESGNDRIETVTVENLRTRDQCAIAAQWFLDATELGDLLPLGQAEFVTGSESQSETGEPGAPATARPANVQAFSICFAVDHLDGEDHVINRPASYAYWRDYVPELRPPWPGKLFSWAAANPRTLDPIAFRFDPHRESAQAFSGLWSYRRILARELFQPGALASDICLVNWPMIDYLRGDLSGFTAEERPAIIADAKQQSLCFLYWLQTEAPRCDGGQGFAALRLRPDVMGTEDGLAKFPYIRESRRICAEYTVCQQHVDARCRPGERRASQFADSVGVGYYRIDLHPTSGGDNYLDVPALPFQIPLGSLIPIRLENLLPAAKNLGVTHITNGCYRLHPVEWNVGEAAGALAAFCLLRQTWPRAVYRQAEKQRLFQDYLISNGIELVWPENLQLDQGDPHAHAR
jgi:hypothetical protein